jgi:Zn-finger protein
MGEKKYNGLVVKKKPFCLDECLYHANATGQDIDNLSLCYCPIFMNIFKVMEG